jgi:choline dehydrogenase-like flavoprotein
MRGDGPLGTALGTYLPRLPWGDHHHRELLRQFGRTATLIVTAEDLPEEHNHVTLDPRLVDSDGIPAPALHYRVSGNSKAILAFGMDRAAEALQEAGASAIIRRPLVNPTGFHLLGTARMGDDPQRSVVDRWCRSHDVPNVYVVDGSVFVTAAAVNPTSTIQALALRAADAIIRSRGRE